MFYCVSLVLDEKAKASEVREHLDKVYGLGDECEEDLSQLKDKEIMAMATMASIIIN